MKWLPAEFAVLGELTLGPAHGYQLKKRLDAGLGPIWHIAPSQLYLILSRLERRGWIRGSLTSQGARPPKRVYSLTPSGERAFWAWVTSPVPRVRDIRVELLAKLYFLRRTSPGSVGELLAAQRERLQRTHRRLSRRGVPTDDALLGEVALNLRLRTIEALLAWLAETEDKFAKEVTNA